MRISPNPVRRLLISKRLAFVYLVFSVIIVLAIGTWFLDLQTDKLLLVKNRSDLASADQIEDVIDHPLEHLIIVPGHSVFIGNDFKNIRESSWFLKSYQRGQTPTLLDQIRRGILETKKDPKSLLLFSGGQTRDFGPISEAQSYWLVAKHNNWFEGGGASLFSRINTEEYARDSFENLLFSVCRFHELTDRWPKKITVIGYGFKKPRFANLHRSAIKFPLDSFNYIGIDPPGDLNDVIESETKNSVVPFTKDPYGCHSLLMQKKLGRNKWNRQNPYKETCAEISGLLNWCSHEDDAKLYPDSLPWSKSK